MTAPTTGGPEPRRGSAWMSDALARVPMPDAPVSRPWELSVSAIVAPRLPGPLRGRARLLDRLGLVRVSPSVIALDASDEVAWSRVVEVRTRPLADVFSTSAIDAASSYASRFLPPIPWATKRVTRWLSGTIADLLLTALLAAAHGHGERAGAAQVPSEIVYLGALGRRRTVTAGLFPASVLALPAVTASVLATASAHRVPIVVVDPARDLAGQQARAAALRQRVALATERLNALRRRAEPPDATSGTSTGSSTP